MRRLGTVSRRCNTLSAAVFINDKRYGGLKEHVDPCGGVTKKKEPRLPKGTSVSGKAEQ
jgi:hypothetical protein